MQVFVLERVIPPLMITFKLAVNSVSSNHIFALFLFLFNSHYLKKVSMDPVQNLSIKIKKYPWTWFMTGGSMEPVQSGGPWTPDPCFVLWIQSDHRIEFSNLSFPIAHLPAGRLTCANSGEIFGGGSAIQRVHEWRSPKFSPNSHKWHEPQFAD